MNEINCLLAEAALRLTTVSATAALDAQVLLAHVLERPRSWVLAHPEAALDPHQAAEFNHALDRLSAGEPLPYVLGHWEFYGLDFLLSAAVLIPRPETELLVEQGLAWLQRNLGRRLALDVGTGSGCIAVSLAHYQPDLRVVAGDISFECLEIARANAHRHGVGERVHLLASDLIPATSRSFDLICANLPYIPQEQLALLPVAQHEPSLALDGGPGGTRWIEKFLEKAPATVAAGGLILLEIEASQGQAVERLARHAFPQAEVRLVADQAGCDRLVAIRVP